MRLQFFIIALLAALSIVAQQPAVIPIAGNAWGDTVWFRLSHTGELDIAVRPTPNNQPTTSSTGQPAASSDGQPATASNNQPTTAANNQPAASSNENPAIISITLAGTTHKIQVPAYTTHPIEAGHWLIRDTGYQQVILTSEPNPTTARRPQQQNATTPQMVQSLVLSGPAATAPMSYVPNNEGNFFYWGRRGPSVHLNYPVADTEKVQWFYSELTVPQDQDRVGSYFMANGFSAGYFGMQVNSPVERRILFSVWSPFTTNDPKAIPDSLRITLIRKGAGVHAGTFGDEGAGGQSYLQYPWVTGTTYRFLLRAEPQAHNHTRFTAWFYPPEQGRWLVIACWDRPATHTWLTHLYSFLENFEPEQGDKDRSAYYGNQWIGDSTGHWTPLTRARFTGDNTARKGYRHDYQGGLHGDTFFLHNGGFFNNYTPLDSWFEHPAPKHTSPPIDSTDFTTSAPSSHSPQRSRIDTLVVHFAFDRSTIRPADSAALRNTRPNTDSILLIGYTDTVGTNNYNLRLSLLRAKAVYAVILRTLAAAQTRTSGQQQPPMRLEARGESNNLPGDDSLSRRVEVIVFYQVKDTPVITQAPPVAHPDDEPDTTFGLDNINFIANTPILTDAARKALPGSVAFLRRFASRYLEIDGYCNSPGAPLEPKDPLFILSIQRAKFIYDYLIQQGFDSTHLRYKGLGNKSPVIAHPTTREESDKNMRVEIRVFHKPPPTSPAE